MGIFLALVVPSKGVHEAVVARLARFIMDMGLINFCFRSDREPAVVRLFQEACRACGREGKNVTQPKDPKEQDK